jgi:hypothetical protein
MFRIDALNVARKGVAVVALKEVEHQCLSMQVKRHAVSITGKNVKDRCD